MITRVVTVERYNLTIMGVVMILNLNRRHVLL